MKAPTPVRICGGCMFVQAGCGILGAFVFLSLALGFWKFHSLMSGLPVAAFTEAKNVLLILGGIVLIYSIAYAVNAYYFLKQNFYAWVIALCLISLGFVYDIASSKSVENIISLVIIWAIWIGCLLYVKKYFGSSRNTPSIPVPPATPIPPTPPVSTATAASTPSPLPPLPPLTNTPPVAPQQPLPPLPERPHDVLPPLPPLPSSAIVPPTQSSTLQVPTNLPPLHEVVTPETPSTPTPLPPLPSSMAPLENLGMPTQAPTVTETHHLQSLDDIAKMKTTGMPPIQINPLDQTTPPQ